MSIEEQACCAHISIQHCHLSWVDKAPNVRGEMCHALLHSERWECRDCHTEFAPRAYTERAAREALEKENEDLIKHIQQLQDHIQHIYRPPSPRVRRVIMDGEIYRDLQILEVQPRYGNDIDVIVAEPDTGYPEPPKPESIE